MAEKVVGKRKGPAPVAEEKDFDRLRRGPSTPKVVPPAPVVKVEEGLLDLLAMMPPLYLFRGSTNEGSSRQSKAARERIKGTLLPKDVKVFELASPEGLIGWSYASSDFVSELTSNFVLFLFFSNAF